MHCFGLLSPSSPESIFGQWQASYVLLSIRGHAEKSERLAGEWSEAMTCLCCPLSARWTTRSAGKTCLQPNKMNYRQFKVVEKLVVRHILHSPVDSMWNLIISWPWITNTLMKLQLRFAQRRVAFSFYKKMNNSASVWIDLWTPGQKI